MGRTGGKWGHFAKAGSGFLEMKRAWGGVEVMYEDSVRATRGSTFEYLLV
jgi:hypothetical protein